MFSDQNQAGQTGGLPLTWFSLALFISLLITALNVAPLNAQGPPDQPVPDGQPLDQVDLLKMPPVDNQKLLDRDKQQPAFGVPLRFAEPLPVDISPSKRGTWETLKNGLRLWRLRIVSEGAVSLNLGFSRYVMPPGGRLFVYSPDVSTVIGPFSAADNEVHGQLWTPLVPGDEIVIEVSLPAAVESQLELNLSRVNHGYREFGAPPDKSGSCNVDVVCSQGDPWRDPIRSVGAYSVNGFNACTGALVNNTAQDLKPYFLTADHCGVNAAEAPSVVVYWNYENSTCRTPGSPASGQPGDGQHNQFNSGAIFRADYALSDFTLLELDDPINVSFNVHWAGWDRSASAPTSAVAIHHPGVEEKRISFENDATAISAYSGNPGSGTDHIRIADWDLGTTEPGSSGSPLFDPNQHIVGQLHGGSAACGNDSPDWYGRLFTSWMGGGTDNSRLSNWLDPLGTGVTSLDGRDEGPDFQLDVTPKTVNICIPNNAVYTASLKSLNGFNDPVTLSTTGVPVGATAGFSPNPVSPADPPALSILTLGNTAAATAGSYALNVVGMTATQTHTSTMTLAVSSGLPGNVNLNTPPHAAANVALAPTFNWSAATQGVSYTLEVATNSGFSHVVYQASVSGLSHNVAATLDYSSRYYWRVTPQNSCGSAAASPVFYFTTVAAPVQSCSTPNIAIPDNTTAGITDTLTVADSGSVLDLNVVISTTHTWVGDLIVTLEHVDTGTSLTLIDRPGGSGSCSGDNIFVTLDDEATLSIETDCSDLQAYLPGGSYRPNELLSRFDNEDMNGDWLLTVSDNAIADTGVLDLWCLQTTLPAAPPSWDTYLPVVWKQE